MKSKFYGHPFQKREPNDIIIEVNNRLIDDFDKATDFEKAVVENIATLFNDDETRQFIIGNLMPGFLKIKLNEVEFYVTHLPYTPYIFAFTEDQLVGKPTDYMTFEIEWREVK